MSNKLNLTNEKLNNRFVNPFALVNYAIELAKTRMKRGEWEDGNPALEVLDLIETGRDLHIESHDEDMSDRNE